MIKENKKLITNVKLLKLHEKMGEKIKKQNLTFQSKKYVKKSFKMINILVKKTFNLVEILKKKTEKLEII